MNTGTVIVLAMSIPLSAGQEVSHIDGQADSRHKENDLQDSSYFLPTHHLSPVVGHCATVSALDHLFD